MQCLLYDTCLAKSITSIINVANQKNIAPEHAAHEQDTFEGYWLLQIRKLEDICRREYESSRDMNRALPNVFFTVAPAEWRYVLPMELTFEESLSNQQAMMTLHLYHSLHALLEEHIFENGKSLAEIGIGTVRHWSIRFEFQSRGTLHVHALLWADLLPGWAVDNIAGRTGHSRSNFLDLLERLFKSRADVQCGDGSHCLLRYVAGYVAKASDALQFNLKQLEGESTWRQAYRLLTKKSPTEQEIIMEFAGLSMVKHSFSGYDPASSQSTRTQSKQAVQHRSCLSIRALRHLRWRLGRHVPARYA